MSEIEQPLVRWNNTYRDAIQSLLATNPTAEEIVAAHPNAHRMGNASVQTCGGTFYDTPARKGREPFPFIRTINAAYEGTKKTALFRGGCLTVFKCNPEDVVLEMVLQHAEADVNVLQNFHGQNDTRMMSMVAAAARSVREDHGYDIHAQGTICVEDNLNVTIESCLETARELINSGHKGFYLKCASGRIKADFMRELVGRLMDEFPEQSVDMHVHHLYGEALPAYVAGIEAAVARGKSIGADVLHPAIAGNTAQPSILDLYDLLKTHHDDNVCASVPKIDYEAIAADMQSLQELRLRYGYAETKYNPRLLQAMYKARAAGGASATLRAIPDLEKCLRSALKLRKKEDDIHDEDWDEIQIAIYEMQAKILPRLGDPTQVTPYAFVTTLEAAWAVTRKAQGKDPLSNITEETADYLVGRLGKVPESTDPELIKMALRKAGLSEPIALLTPDQFQGGMETAREKLRDAGIQAPTQEEILYVATLRDNSNQKRGLELVLAARNGTLKPQAIPDLPIAKYLPKPGGAINGESVVNYAPASLSAQFSGSQGSGIRLKLAEHLDEKILAAIGGVAGFEALSQHILTLYRAAVPANLPQQQLPTCFAIVESFRNQQADDAIVQMRESVDRAYADKAPSAQQVLLLNRVIAELCSARGIKSPELSKVFLPFDRRSFTAYKQKVPTTSDQPQAAVA
jgi:pyruvate/oxaloacetate carboxyltransferase